MHLTLTDTVEYDGETLEYERSYFTRGMMNPGVRVYEGTEYTLHYNPDTGLAQVTDGEGNAERVEPENPPYKSDETVVVVQRN